MSLSTYSIDSTKIVKYAKVDFGKPTFIQDTVRLTQYDKTLPILAVSLYIDGEAYSLPATADLNIRWGKRDRTFSYNPALGCNSDRTVAYFEITEQMTSIEGIISPIVELDMDNGLAGSSQIPVVIDRNPIQDSDTPSAVEAGVLEKAVEDARAAGFTEILYEILYSDLLTLVNTSNLIKGMQYRIIDYAPTCTTSTIKYAGHQFDIIVTADSTSTLNKTCRFAKHDGDTYFANCDLSKWTGQYDINGTITPTSGNEFGLITDLKDEFGNECGYDFKNLTRLGNSIQGYTTFGLTTTAYYYTFSSGTGTGATDLSIAGTTNNIRDNDLSKIAYDKQITFLGSGCYSNTFGSGCYSNTFGSGCNSNTFGSSCYYNTFDSYCYSNTFDSGCYSNTFGSYCYLNTFGAGCYSNTFGPRCNYNTFGSYCDYNTFGLYCYSNTFGSGCNYNTFGPRCYSNTFDSGCYSNTFGSYCYSNTFGSGCYSNTFGSNCDYNTFGLYCYYNTFGSGCNYNTFDSGCVYLKVTTAISNKVIDSVIQGASSSNQFELYCSNLPAGLATLSKDSAGNYIWHWKDSKNHEIGYYKTSNTDTVWKKLETDNAALTEIDFSISGNPATDSNVLKYFDVTGSGTSASHFVFTPRTDVNHSKNWYVLTINTEPSATYYIDFESKGSSPCMVSLIRGSTSFATNHYYTNFLNYLGKTRWRITYAGTLIQTSLSTSGTSWTITTNINSADVYSSTNN